MRTDQRRNTPPPPQQQQPMMQGKAAEFVRAERLRDDDIIACPGKPLEQAVPRRLEAVVVDGEQVRVKTRGVDKWYTFRVGDPVLRRRAGAR